MTPTPIESLQASETVPVSATAELGAWNLRKLIPSELAAKPALRWPLEASEAIGVPAPTLRKRQAEGDHPRLYAIGRAMFTTIPDLRDWVVAHEVAPGFRVRDAGPGRPRRSRERGTS